MVTRSFCDLCDAQMKDGRNYNDTEAIPVTMGGKAAWLRVSLNTETGKLSHVCKACVLAAFDDFDNRPRAGAPKVYTGQGAES